MELLGQDVSVTWTLVIGAVLLFVWYDRWRHQYLQRRGISVADYLPVFGNVLQWRRPIGLVLKSLSMGIQTTFTDYVEKYGRVVGTYDFYRPVLIIADADLLKNILVKNFSSFQNRRKLAIVQKPISRGLTRLVDEEWKEIRSVITPSFSASKMRKMSFMINECCDVLVDNISKAQQDGKAIDFRVVFGGYTMDVIAKCGFGLEVDSQGNTEDPFVQNARRLFTLNRLNPLILVLSLFPFMGRVLATLNISLVASDSLKFFMDATEAACRMRTAEGAQASKRVDLLQLMLNAHNDPEGDREDTPTSDQATGRGVAQRKPLSPGDVVAQSILFFLAGYETTNTLLSFTAYLLATNQDAQEKLHAEIDNLAPTRDNLGYDVIGKMEYLDMVISESLRMYPPTVIFDRECNDTITYEDFTVDKGVGVLVSVWTIHHDEEYWTNPTQFDPERFSPENKAAIKPCTFLPFGFGPRNCIGMRFALLEAKMALVRVLQRYCFDVCPKTEIPPTIGKAGLLSPKNMYLNVIPRN